MVAAFVQSVGRPGMSVLKSAGFGTVVVGAAVVAGAVEAVVVEAVCASAAPPEKIVAIATIRPTMVMGESPLRFNMNPPGSIRYRPKPFLWDHPTKPLIVGQRSIGLLLDNKQTLR